MSLLLRMSRAALPVAILPLLAVAPGVRAQTPAEAAAGIAASAPACRDASPFYWEIGDARGPLASGRVGAMAPAADTVMAVASASKWLYGAYVAELRGGRLSAGDIAALTMRSGYTGLEYTRCLRLLPGRQQRETVAECLADGGNDRFDAAAVGRFHYNGGHFQQHAVHALGLGELDSRALSAAVAQRLGLGGPFSYQSPQLAAGVSTSAATYAGFLRRLLRGELALSGMLGSEAVCTNPATCAQAESTPIPDGESWQYALGHWVESDPRVGDGSFSSPGAFGFYPWIDAGRTTYGILARHALGRQAYYTSVQCGRQIRQAWLRAPR